jgi:hypothetical protein
MDRTLSMDNYVVSGTLDAAREDGGANSSSGSSTSSTSTSTSTSSRVGHDARQFRLPEAFAGTTTKLPTIITIANAPLRSGEGSNADEGDNSGAVSAAAAAAAPRATGETYGSTAATPSWSEATVELHVGPGEPDEGVAHLISESPTGTDTPIYETAYREEVERIRRAQGRAATVFLTRRVEAAGAAAGAGSVPGTADERPRIRWGEVLERAKTMTRPTTDAQ